MEKTKTFLKLKEEFQSPTYGKMGLSSMLKRISLYMEESPEDKYRIVIGTDSNGRNRGNVDFITAVIVHRVGRGGIYFWKKKVEEKIYSLRERIYTEALLSLELASGLLKDFQKVGILGYDLEIHVDIGKVGETKDMVKEVVGMIRGSGFEVRTKPEAYGASTVADRHT